MVASNISGNRDVVVHGESGVLFEPGDVEGLASSISSVLTDSDYHQQLVFGAQKKMEQFDWRVIAERYVEVYREAIQAKQA